MPTSDGGRFSAKIRTTELWGMVLAGIQFLVVFVYSGFAHGTLESFLSFSNVKF